jgi:hypothetical protein
MNQMPQGNTVIHLVGRISQDYFAGRLLFSSESDLRGGLFRQLGAQSQKVVTFAGGSCVVGSSRCQYWL